MDPRQTGSIFENFVVSKLPIKQATWSEHSVRLFHFRSQKGAEVDIVLEDTMGNIVGIEVKYSDSITASDFKGLHYLRELAGDKFLKGVILYAGKSTIPLGKDLFALPIDSLWAIITTANQLSGEIFPSVGEYFPKLSKLAAGRP